MTNERRSTLHDNILKELPAKRLGTHPLDVLAGELGVADAYQGGTEFPGSIYLTIEQPAERTGGYVPDTGDDFAAWIGDWLRGPQQADVLHKLVQSGRSERHAFVILPGFTTAPFSVSYLLMRPDAPLPLMEPVLPAAVTHVWAVSTWSIGIGFRWGPVDGWLRFEKHPSGR